MTEQSQTQHSYVDDDDEDRELHTKEDIAWRIRKTSYIKGQADMLADLFGGNIDHDPLAFMIACEIRYYGDMNRMFRRPPEETEAIITSWMRSVKQPRTVGLLRSLSRRKLTIKITVFIEKRPTARIPSAQSSVATKIP